MQGLNERQIMALRRALAGLAQTGVAPRAADALDATMGSAGAALLASVLAEIPAFAASGNPAILPSLKQHARDHLDEIRRLFGGGDLEDFAFVRTHARLRAEQRFPLEATLHAYRCGHRTLSRWMREAAVASIPGGVEAAISAVADFSIEYTDAISTIVAAEYVAQTRRVADAERDLRTELLAILLSGYDESDARVAQLLRRAGYLEQRLSYVVAAAQSVNAAEMESLSRAQRIVSALAEAVGDTQMRTLGGVRDHLAIMVFADRRRLSGWTAPNVNLAGRVRDALLAIGPAVLVGISAEHPSTAFVPKALNEARIALDFAGPARRVVGFGDLPVRGLLVHRGAAALRLTPPPWAQALVEADAAAGGALVATLRAIADADLNMQKAARLLGKHPNTLYARIGRIRELTGLDAQRYPELTEMTLVADCWRI